MRTHESLERRRAYAREYQAQRRQDPEFREQKRLYIAQRRRDPAYREARNKYMSQRHRERIEMATGVLGGRCAQCGATEGLEFDHVDPRTKSFSIGMRAASVSEARLLAELEKCQLLCTSCHREKTREWSGSRERGSLGRFVAA